MRILVPVTCNFGLPIVKAMLCPLLGVNLISEKLVTHLNLKPSSRLSQPVKICDFNSVFIRIKDFNKPIKCMVMTELNVEAPAAGDVDLVLGNEVAKNCIDGTIDYKNGLCLDLQ